MLVKHTIPTSEMRNLHKNETPTKDDDARGWRSFFFSVLSSRGVVRPSPTQRGLFFVVFVVVVEEKGFFEHSECDDDSDERSDFGIDDAMVFVLFVVFKLEGDA